MTHELGLGIVQVALAGRLDITTARLAARALRMAQAGSLLVVLDLRRVQFVGCTAARASIGHQRHPRRRAPDELHAPEIEDDQQGAGLGHP